MANTFSVRDAMAFEDKFLLRQNIAQQVLLAKFGKSLFLILSVPSLCIKTVSLAMTVDRYWEEIYFLS